MLWRSARRVSCRAWYSIHSCREQTACCAALPSVLPSVNSTHLARYLQRQAAFQTTCQGFSSAGLAESESPHEYDSYQVDIQTGNVRGAGTKARAWVQLVGTHGVSDKVCFEGSDDGFPRGSNLTMQVHVPKELGVLKRVFVERAKRSASDVGDGWFLEHVMVHGPHGELTVFPCHSWFGSSDCGYINGPLERNLIPAEASQVKEEYVPAPVQVVSAGVSYPHPDKVKNDKAKAVNTKHFGYGGEDAYFHITGKNHIYGMGVADGVYSWKEVGIDSGTMSRALVETAEHMVQAGYEDVVKMMQTAARHVQSEGLLGSSTLCLLTVNKPQGRLAAANLGDSGFMVLGSPLGQPQEAPQVRFRTVQLEHEFGRPFQLGHHAAGSRPEDAECVALAVQPGDVIVMGSDGLFDNLSDSELLQETFKLKRSGARPFTVVQHLAKLAYDSSRDRRKVTPYSEAASEAFNMVYSGGKPDDITVLVAFLE